VQLILLLLAASAFVAASAWLASRWSSVRGARVGAEQLKRIAQLTGGQVSKTGIVGADCVLLARQGLNSRILLHQQAGATVVRRTTHILIDAPTRANLADVGVVTLGNSEPYSFMNVGGTPIGPMPKGWPAGLEAHSEYVVPALKTLREPGVVELVTALRERCGLARWELVLAGTGLRYAIDGFLLEDGAILDLHDILWRFMSGRETAPVEQDNEG